MTSNLFELIIYIPTFNRSEKLKNSLKVISREIIGLEDKVLVYVSNNGSSDGTREYLASLDFKWLHIRHNEENVGAALNVLHCFNLPMETEFVWIVGDDDYLMPNAISGILSIIKEYPTTDYIFCNTKAFPHQQSDEILKKYFETGSINGGTVKSRRYTGTSLVDFEQLIDPDIADTLLCELMLHCFRQSSVRFDSREVMKYFVDDVNWEDIDFETAGKIYTPQNLPFLNCFTGKTKAVYCDSPRTFNFWGSANWQLIDYDHVFPIVILFLISQYRERGFISEEKVIKLLDYYYLIMGGSLTRQINGQSTARSFNSKIKAKMFEFLLLYMNKHGEESNRKPPTAASRVGNDERKAATRPNKQPDRFIETTQKATKSASIPTKSSPNVPFTSIIILAFNQIEHTKPCLQSIEQYTPEPHELILVDNGSTDGTLDYLRKYAEDHNNVRVISNKENLGFAAGNNQGLAVANGNYMLLLNNDTIVTEGWLARMLSVFERYPEVGIVGPVSNNISGPQQVKEASYQSLGKMHHFAKHWSAAHTGQTIESYRVVGFCLLAKREVIDRIGGLDEIFGSGNFEDDDFCLRAAVAGYKARIAQDAFIHHTGSQTFKGAGINYRQSLERNWEIFKTKWKLPKDLPYGANYTLNLDTRDLSQYYMPLKGQADLFQAAAVKEIPSLMHLEFMKGTTSIIIPVQSVHLDECISSIKKNTDEPHEIIFLGHGVAPKLKKQFMKSIKENRNYKFIEIDKTSNFTQSLNEGINQSTGEYIVLLFDDVVVCENWLSDMLECLHSGKKIGIVGAMSDDASSLQRVEDIDFKSPENRLSFRERNRHRRIHTRNLDGFCMLFRRDLPIRIGLFHEILGEDKHVLDDFCARAVLEGYNNVVAGDVFIHHSGSMSFIKNRTYFDSVFKRNVFGDKWDSIDQRNIFGKKLVAIEALDRAQEFKHRGQSDKAVQTLLETLDSIHEEREIYYFLVEILIDIKKYDDALKVLESIPDDSDTDISKLVLIGYCKEGLGLPTEAVGYAEQVLCLDTSNAAALNLKGILAYKQNHYQAAEKLFRQAIKFDPGYGKPYGNLGLLNLATGQHQEALRLMEQGFILSPTSTDIAASYHNAVTMSKQFARAEIIFREAKTIYPHNKQIIFLLIDLLLRQVKYADAMVEIEQAMILFGYEQGILAAALDIRNIIGPKEIDATSKKNNPLSLCMVVKNDEPNLARCFKNIKSIAQEIIIVDLCSNDRTKKIATAFGAKVYDAPKTENMDELRSFSLAKATGDWILVLDADESISPLDYPPLTNLIAQQGLRQIAYAFIIRNYLAPVHLPGRIANDGKYIDEETGTGWVPSKKVRLFPKDNRIRFSNSACETLESSLNDLGIDIESCEIPIHHYGKLDVV